MPHRPVRSTNPFRNPWRVLFLALAGPVTFVLIVLAFHLESPEIPHSRWTDDGAMIADFGSRMWIDQTGAAPARPLDPVGAGVAWLGCGR